MINPPNILVTVKWLLPILQIQLRHLHNELQIYENASELTVIADKYQHTFEFVSLCHAPKVTDITDTLQLIEITLKAVASKELDASFVVTVLKVNEVLLNAIEGYQKNGDDFELFIKVCYEKFYNDISQELIGLDECIEKQKNRSHNIGNVKQSEELTEAVYQLTAYIDTASFASKNSPITQAQLPLLLKAWRYSLKGLLDGATIDESLLRLIQISQYLRQIVLVSDVDDTECLHSKLWHIANVWLKSLYANNLPKPLHINVLANLEALITSYTIDSDYATNQALVNETFIEFYVLLWSLDNLFNLLLAEQSQSLILEADVNESALTEEAQQVLASLQKGLVLNYHLLPTIAVKVHELDRLSNVAPDDISELADTDLIHYSDAGEVVLTFPNATWKDGDTSNDNTLYDAEESNIKESYSSTNNADSLAVFPAHSLINTALYQIATNHSQDVQIIRQYLHKYVASDSLLAAQAKLKSDDFAMDEAIRDVFVEEAEDALAVFNANLPEWQADLNDIQAIKDIRKGFHTLKGSGRMVGAYNVAEMAWAVESLLNQILNNELEATQQIVSFLFEVKAIIPLVVKDFASAQQPYIDLAVVMVKADNLQHGRDVDFDLKIDSSVEPQPFPNLEAYINTLSTTAEQTKELKPVVNIEFTDDKTTVFDDNGAYILDEEVELPDLLAKDKVVEDEDTEYSSGTNINEVEYSALQTQSIVDNGKTDSHAQIISEQNQYCELSSLPEVIQSFMDKIDIPEDDSDADPDIKEIFIEEAYEVLGEIKPHYHKWVAWFTKKQADEGNKQTEDLSGNDITDSIAEEALTEVRRGFHTLKGSGRMVGANSSAELAWAVEDMLNRVIKKQIELSPAMQQLVGDVIDAYPHLVVTFEQGDGEYPQLMPIWIACANAYSKNEGHLFDYTHLVTNVFANKDNEATHEVNTQVLDNEPVVETEVESLVSEASVIEEAELNSSSHELIDDAATVDDTSNDSIASLAKELTAISQTVDKTASEVATESPVNMFSSDTESLVQTSQSAFDIEIFEGDRDILEIFLEEAQEIDVEISTTFEEWAQNPENIAALSVLQRYLHTIKGGARMAGVQSISDLTHEAETLYECFVDGRIKPTHEWVAVMQGVQDCLSAQIEHVVEQGNSFYANELVAQLKSLSKAKTIATDFQLASPLLALDTVANSANISSSQNKKQQSNNAEIETITTESSFVQQADTTATLSSKDNSSIEERNTATLNDVSKQVLSNSPAQQDSHTQSTSVDIPAYDVAQPPPSQGNFISTVKNDLQHGEMIRVSANLMGKLINLSGESAINRVRIDMNTAGLNFTIDEMEETVQRLIDQLRRMDFELETALLPRMEANWHKYHKNQQTDNKHADSKDFDPLEMDQYSSFNQLSKFLAESASDLLEIQHTLRNKTHHSEYLLRQLSHIQTQLHDGLMYSRLVPFSRILPRLQRIVRQTASQLGKSVELVFVNADDEIDRSILERITSPLEHMLRNAVDHGIEMPDEREKLGKSRTGKVVLEMARNNDEIVIKLSDDGKGIDIDAVRSKAIEQGLIDKDDTTITDIDVMQYIFNAGLSTSKNVTQISGRGVGMDVVMSEVRQLGGTVFAQSQHGQGSTFSMQVPLTIAITEVLMVKVANKQYAIPLLQIERVERIDYDELLNFYQAQEKMFAINGTDYRLRYLGEMLFNQQAYDIISHNYELGKDTSLPVVIIKQQVGQHLAIGVDEVIGSRVEVVVKPLGRQLQNMKALSAATILGDGSVTLILDMIDLLRNTPFKVLETQKIPYNVEQNKHKAKILIVDDSVTVRKVTSRLLTRNGYETFVARDGLEALELLRTLTPDVMLLDIEMPRMDGFEVATQVRDNAKLRDLPIIMISSRTGERHKQRAMQIGVNEFMGKPFEETNLLKSIENYINLMRRA